MADHKSPQPALKIACFLGIAIAWAPSSPCEDPPPPARVNLSLACKFLVGKGRVQSIDVTRHNEVVTMAVCDEEGKLQCIRRREGGWSSQSTMIDSNGKAVGLRLIDLDDDGELELLVTSRTLQVFSLRDRIELVWSSPALFDDVSAPRIEPVDFENDGKKEIVVVNYKRRERPKNESSVFVFRQDAAKPTELNLIDSITLTDEHQYHSTAGLAVGDFAGNGQSQIAVGNDNGWLWMIDFIDDQLEIFHSWKVPAGGAVNRGLAAGPLDEKPGVELLVGTNGGNLFVFGFSNQHRLPDLIASGSTGRLAYGVTSGDYDGDGKNEFGLSRGHTGYARMTGDDVVAEVWRIDDTTLKPDWRAPTLDSPRAITRDLDGDGTDEMIILSGTDGDVSHVKPYQ